MSTKPMKPITKPGEGKPRQKYLTQEQLDIVDEKTGKMVQRILKEKGKS